MVKRVCRCGRVFSSDNGSFRCDDCTRWNNYITTHPQPEHKRIVSLPELKFFFDETMVSRVFDTTKSKVVGSFESKNGKFSIHIYLFNFNKEEKELRMILNICQTLSHEYLHMSIAEYSKEPQETNKKLDASGLMKLLENYYM